MNQIINNPTLISQIALAVAPEPSSYALFGIGVIGILMVIRRRNTA